MSKRRRKLIKLSTCSCSICKGRAAVCMEGFSWVDRRDPNHHQRHAQEDLLKYLRQAPITGPAGAAYSRRERVLVVRGDLGEQLWSRDGRPSHP
jgi:hypothetical protein